MGIGQLCKNIEGDPAKPGRAATICWRQLKCQSGSQHLAVFLECGRERFVGDKRKVGLRVDRWMVRRIERLAHVVGDGETSAASGETVVGDSATVRRELDMHPIDVNKAASV